MPTDSKKRPGRGFASTARAAAVTRFIKKNLNVTIVNSADRGAYGIAVHQDPYATKVWLHVTLPDDQAALACAAEIEETFAEHGFEVTRNGNHLSVTKKAWRHDDAMRTLFARCFGRSAENALISDSALIAAPAHIVDALREQGVFQDGTLRLTELGGQARAWAIAEQKKRTQAEHRRLRERGW